MSFTYNNCNIDEAGLAEIRWQLYHSRGDGYYVLRQFIDPVMTRHIRKVWTQVAPYFMHEEFTGWEDYSIDSPNVERRGADGNYFFNNFLHNKPLDAATQSVSGYISILRNRIEGKDPFTYIVPHDQGAVAYRVVVTRNMQVAAPPHRDWVESETYDLSAVQATLMLATPGEDYSGEGFSLVDNGGRRVVFGADVAVEAGDLIVWRFNNQHAVMNVHSREDQIGFARIIYSWFTRTEKAAAAPKAKPDAGPKAEPTPEPEPAPTPTPLPAPAVHDEAAVMPADSPPTAVAAAEVSGADAAPPVFAAGMREAIKRTRIGRLVIVPVYRKIRYRS